MRIEKNFLALSSERVDLWLVFIDEIHDEALISKYHALLAQEEQERYARFYFARERHRYLITRALVREVLSRYAPIPPKEWRFAATPYGRPFIANDHDAAKHISFNISHTNGLIMLGVVRERALGIDTESLANNTPLGIADHFFSPEENCMLHRLPPPLRSHRFLELWTLKESYIKACGMGLSMPLDQFSFRFDANQKASIAFHTDIDASEEWKFLQWRPSMHHVAALCLQAAEDTKFNITARQIVPLSHEYFVDMPDVVQ